MQNSVTLCCTLLSVYTFTTVISVSESDKNHSITNGRRCHSYYDANGTLQPDHFCKAGQYCSGTCVQRFCSSSAMQLNQSACENQHSELKWCDEYKDAWNAYSSREMCARGLFCCGTCGKRYCCSSLDQKLDQSTCVRTSTVLNSSISYYLRCEQ